MNNDKMYDMQFNCELSKALSILLTVYSLPSMILVHLVKRSIYSNRTITVKY